VAANLDPVGARPAAGVLGDLYTAPAAGSIISSIAVTNIGLATTFRVRVAPLGAADAATHAVFHDAPLAANATLVLTCGMTLVGTDKLRVQSATGDVVFHAWGQEL
jgi:hypothetical protein